LFHLGDQFAEGLVEYPKKGGNVFSADVTHEKTAYFFWASLRATLTGRKGKGGRGGWTVGYFL